jgi:hypothetical protein
VNLQVSPRYFTNQMSMPLAKRQSIRCYLRVGLAALWLLDAALQFQPYMFSRAFATDVVGSTAAGNPGPVAWPITFSAGLIVNHSVIYNAIFASIQLLIAIGLLRSRTAKLALGVSVGWSLSVWWLGEGLGGILTGGTTVYMGAPGAAVLYTFIAILVWPRAQVVTPGSSLAGTSPLGSIIPMLAWTALWASFVYYALQPAMRAPQSLSAMMSGMAGGEPGWITAMDGSLSRVLAGHGTQVSIALAALFALAGVAVFVPRAARAGVILAVALGALLWVSQDFGTIFTGHATDPNTGLPLMLLASCYWPIAGARPGVSRPGGTTRVGSEVLRISSDRPSAVRAA